MLDNKKEMYKPPVVMTFSMHDATGGSGVVADIEAISSQGCHSCPVVTSLSVQDSLSISGLIPIDEDIVIQSARAVLEDIPVSAFKIGVLASVEVVEAVHSILFDYQHVPVIFNPMFFSNAGGELADNEIIDAIKTLLLPLTDVLTPGLAEAAALMPEADSSNAMVNGIIENGCGHVLLTTTQADKQLLINRLFHNYREIDRYEWQRLPNEYQGCGCTLSSTLAALMAQGLDVLSATREAQNFTWQSLKHARRLGMGQHFPNRHFWLEQE